MSQIVMIQRIETLNFVTLTPPLFLAGLDLLLTVHWKTKYSYIKKEKMHSTPSLCLKENEKKMSQGTFNYCR